MLTFKLIGLIVLFIQIITLEFNIVHFSFIVLELAAIIKAARIKAILLLRRNFIILSFSIFFGIFIIVSSLVNNGLNIKQTCDIIIKMFFTFNCIFISGTWIGRKGLMRIINRMRSDRIFLFIIFFIKITEYLVRTHGKIINQLKARLDFSYSNKFLIARYYGQNLIYKELYALHHYQAAFYTRISGRVPVFFENENAGFSDIAAFIVLLIGSGVYFLI